MAKGEAVAFLDAQRLELRARAKDRYDSAKVLASWAQTARFLAVQASYSDGSQRSQLRHDALNTAERCVRYVDEAMWKLDHVRLELMAIAVGEREHQTEQMPETNYLSRDLGELKAMLMVLAMLAKYDSGTTGGAR